MKCIKSKLIVVVTTIFMLDIILCNNIFAKGIPIGHRPSFVGANGCVVQYKPLDKANAGVLIIYSQDYYMSPQAAHNFADDLTPSRTESLLEFIASLITIPITSGVSIGTALGAYFYLDSDGETSLSNKIKNQIQKSYDDGNNGYIRITVQYYHNNASSVSGMTTYDTSDWNGTDIYYLNGFNVQKIYRLD
ncbi:hypothetical protein [Clostridium hydrogenum]|uniref:hypothetical protein n=1 Tax=Clostridium hydrogenum TaxID=2855764 RepID=UPI001F22ADC3|nr:hypothetical protein [Clostridium hydrogenum]